jgi:hypothetical protein
VQIDKFPPDFEKAFAPLRIQTGRNHSPQKVLPGRLLKSAPVTLTNGAVTTQKFENALFKVICILAILDAVVKFNQGHFSRAIC